MKEVVWAKELAAKLNVQLRKSDSSLKVETGLRLPYAYEIREYDQNGDPLLTDKMKYETDLLISEYSNEDAWKPRVIIECKLKSVTTHDSITYSKKANSHKSIHPYLRYGILIGKRDHHPLPGRLFRHGENFDFMISFKNYNSTKKEWNETISILNQEVEASRNLEKIIYQSRSKNRMKITFLHKPLTLK